MLDEARVAAAGCHHDTTWGARRQHIRRREFETTPTLVAWTARLGSLRSAEDYVLEPQGRIRARPVARLVAGARPWRVLCPSIAFMPTAQWARNSPRSEIVVGDHVSTPRRSRAASEHTPLGAQAAGRGFGKSPVRRPRGFRRSETSTTEELGDER